jgi:hypothetical protein
VPNSLCVVLIQLLPIYAQHGTNATETTIVTVDLAETTTVIRLGRS